MSGANLLAVDPLRIESNGEDDYLNSVKQFLGLGGEVSPKKSETPRRSARVSTSLYKDYSHVKDFKALPAIKLTLSLRNLPKYKPPEESFGKRTKKTTNNNNKCSKPISTEELQQILEEPPNLAEKMPVERDEKRVSMDQDNRKVKSMIVKPGRKKRKVQTEASKKFQKLKNACRRQYGRKEFRASKAAAPLSDNTPAQAIEPKPIELNPPPDIDKDSEPPPNDTTSENSADKPPNKNNEDNIDTNTSKVKETPIGKHNLPVVIPERRSSIAEPLRVATPKTSNEQLKVVCSNATEENTKTFLNENTKTLQSENTETLQNENTKTLQSEKTETLQVENTKTLQNETQPFPNETQQFPNENTTKTILNENSITHQDEPTMIYIKSPETLRDNSPTNTIYLIEDISNDGSTLSAKETNLPPTTEFFNHPSVKRTATSTKTTDEHGKSEEAAPSKKRRYKEPTTLSPQPLHSQELFNLARRHYERLARYDISNGERLKVSNTELNGERLNVSNTERSATIQHQFETTENCTHEKSNKLHLTQCHPVSESKSSTIDYPLNMCLKHVVETQKLPNTSPLTISDSSSTADTDVEFEVDVVGNDTIEDKLSDYSLINPRPEAAASTSPIKKSPPEYAEKIRKLRGIIELLLQRAAPQCSQEDLAQIRRVLEETNETSPKSTQIAPPRQHLSITGNTILPRSTVITAPNQNPVQQAIQDVIKESLRERSVASHSPYSLPKDILTRSYNSLQYTPNKHRSSSVPLYKPNELYSTYYKPPQNQIDHARLLRDFAKIMHNKELKKQSPHDAYLKNYQQTSHIHNLLNVPQPYKLLRPKTIKSAASERPPIIYTPNVARATTSNGLAYEHHQKELSETSVRSPDSGYISPLRKVSPQLEQQDHGRSYKTMESNANVIEQHALDKLIQQLLPKLHYCGTLTPEQYVKEMCTLENEPCPPFLMQFYSYVTKKQIASNQLPISFKIFLEFRSAGKLRVYENSFAIYMKKREQERYLKHHC